MKTRRHSVSGCGPSRRSSTPGRSPSSRPAASDAGGAAWRWAPEAARSPGGWPTAWPPTGSWWRPIGSTTVLDGYRTRTSRCGPMTCSRTTCPSASSMSSTWACCWRGWPTAEPCCGGSSGRSSQGVGSSARSSTSAPRCPTRAWARTSARGSRASSRLITPSSPTVTASSPPTAVGSPAISRTPGSRTAAASAARRCGAAERPAARSGASPLMQLREGIVASGLMKAADGRRPNGRRPRCLLGTPWVSRQALAGWGSGRMITVSATAMISSTGRSASLACLRIASGLEAS